MEPVVKLIVLTILALTYAGMLWLASPTDPKNGDELISCNWQSRKGKPAARPA